MAMGWRLPITLHTPTVVAKKPSSSSIPLVVNAAGDGRAQSPDVWVTIERPLIMTAAARKPAVSMMIAAAGRPQTSPSTARYGLSQAGNRSTPSIGTAQDHPGRRPSPSDSAAGIGVGIDHVLVQREMVGNTPRSPPPAAVTPAFDRLGQTRARFPLAGLSSLSSSRSPMIGRRRTLFHHTLRTGRPKRPAYAFLSVSPPAK